MKNKITFKTLIVAIMITAILSGTVGVLGVQVLAKNVNFTPTDEEWNVTNVEDAMNDLYVLGKNATFDIEFTLAASTSITLNSHSVATYLNSNIKFNKSHAEHIKNVTVTTGSVVYNGTTYATGESFTLVDNLDTHTIALSTKSWSAVVTSATYSNNATIKVTFSI